MSNAAHNMLSRVVLHTGKAGIPIQNALHCIAYGQWRIGVMPYLSVYDLHVGHGHTAQQTGIGGLASPFWEEGSSIQLHCITTITRSARYHNSAKATAIAIQFI
jgi:hypothetical protein